MMRSGISSYTPNRQVQKVNFSSIWVQDWVKKHCGLTDSDISALNSRCPHNLYVNVEDFGTDGQHIEVCRAHINDGKFRDYKDFDVYYDCSDEHKAKKASKENFMDCINRILSRYSD